MIFNTIKTLPLHMDFKEYVNIDIWKGFVADIAAA